MSKPYSSLSMIKRAAARRQHEVAASEALERETATWQYKLRSWGALLLVIYPICVVYLLAAIYPFLIPRDLEALGYIALAAVPFSLMILGGFVVDEWVKDRVEGYWFWRLSTTAVFLAIGAALLYGLVVSSAAWLPHFR